MYWLKKQPNMTQSKAQLNKNHLCDRLFTGW